MNGWIWFASINELGPVKKKKLLEKFQTPEKIFDASKDELLKVEGMTEKIVIAMEKMKQKEIWQKYENYIAKNHIQLVNIVDKEYPIKLKQIYDPPITLFCIGDITLLHKISIGVVGTRMPSPYGKNMAKQFSEQLSKKGIVIVSGMARGIDAYAHKGAINADGKTIAVLRVRSGQDLS